MKYGNGKSRHRYEVRAYRRVAIPEYGPEAYYIDVREEVFPYGKGQHYANGKAAKQAALSRCIDLTPMASEVSLWECNGYGGRGTYMKSSDERFTSKWTELEAL